MPVVYAFTQGTAESATLTSDDGHGTVLGRQAGLTVLALAEGKAVEHGLRRLPCKLVVRDSCGGRQILWEEGVREDATPNTGGMTDRVAASCCDRSFSHPPWKDARNLQSLGRIEDGHRRLWESEPEERT